MFKRSTYIISVIFLTFVFIVNTSFAEVIKKIEITGNERIPDATIKALSSIKINQVITENDLNNITKDLYESNFFENISLSIKKDTLIINVKENPIIGNIEIKGVKSNTIKKEIDDKLILKSRASYNKILLKDDKNSITNVLRNLGYYSADVNVLLENQSKNIIDIIYEIDLGKKAKIKKITFTGNKVYKDSKLKSIIISEEYKPWKFMSGKKYLNENNISIDNRLLKNFYLNKGYYFAQINSSFAKVIDEESFELIFNIDAYEKYYFDNLDLELPIEYDETNYDKIYNLFSSYKNKPYSINKISKILESIDEITSSEQFESTKSFVEEDFVENKINLKFLIQETEKIYVKKINIFGNNVTRESVIRNQFVLDEVPI